MIDARYPIGPFKAPSGLTTSDRLRAVQEIASAPAELRLAIRGLTDAQLDTPYRPSGWTVRQVVHHLPDSHMNSYLRLKRALTEDNPIVQTYDEAAFARLSDSEGEIEQSLALLEHLHARWVYLWERLSDADWKRRLRHPEMGEMGLGNLLALYAWHGKHHVAHITSLRTKRGWW